MKRNESDSQPAMEMRMLDESEIEAVSGGAVNIADVATKVVKSAAMIGGVIAATVLYLSLPPCD